jgi:hypothetical protein
MIKNKRLLLAVAVAAGTGLTSLSANAFFGPFNFMRGWGGGPWGWGGGPWGWGYPGYGWGYPGYGWGYPGYGWGYPGYGWGYPYAVGVPYLTYPALTAPSAPKAPESKAAK